MVFSFTGQQQITLAAVANRIVPADETCGAGDAGAVDFISRLLNAEAAEQTQNYIEGLSGIDREAHAVHGKAFAKLTASQQDAVLTAIETDEVKTAWSVTPSDFFKLLVENVQEGFYADPGNGGNRDGVSWKMIGYRAEGGTRGSTASSTGGSTE